MGIAEKSPPSVSPPSSRIMHLDMDSFFVSVEVLKDPFLQGRPVAVGDPGPRGVVASASYEARKFGVRSAMPSAHARRLCPGLVFLPGRHREYAAFSGRVREILEGYSPRVEAASIDEFYLDLAGCEKLHGNFFAAGAALCRRIRDELGLPASLGIGANRTLAKIASKVAKPRGVLEVLPGREEVFMAPLPVRMIPGVGPAAEKELARMGVRKAGDLAAIPPGLLEKVMGAYGLELHLKARGLWRGGRVEGPRSPLSVGHETTFAEDTVDPLFLEAILFSLVERSAVRLRGLGLEAGKVAVKVRYADFSTHSRRASLTPTCLEKEIFGEARVALRALISRRLRVRLVGVSLSRLRPAGYQDDLFVRPANGRRREACRCLDRVKERFGFRALAWAAGRASPAA